MTHGSPSSTFDYINSHYGLDVRVGDYLMFMHKKACVVESHGNYVGVRMLDGGGTVSIHPTWRVEYLPRQNEHSGGDRG